MIAIVLVNYNGAKDTVDCIKSLSKILNYNYKILVVDNCSTDDSVSRLVEAQKIYNFDLIKSDSNEGFSAGNNIGIRSICNADYYLLLNNDTTVDKNFLNLLLEPFKKIKDCGITTSRIMYYSQPDVVWYNGGDINERTSRTRHFNYNEKYVNTGESKMREVSFASGCCMLISKKTIEKVGFLDENYFLYEEDADYCYRVTHSGFKIIHVPESIIYHKVSASTGQGSPLSQFYSVRNKYYFIKTNFKNFNKVTAYIFCSIQFLNRIFKREISIKYYFKGLKSFVLKEVGRKEGQI